jgi:hypothetical protein
MRGWNGTGAVGALIFAGVLAGCGDASGPSRGWREVGVLQLGRELLVEGAGGAEGDRGVRWDVQPGPGDLIPPEVLVVPDTVVARGPFEVKVTTIGSNGCWSAEGQEVEIGVGVVLVTAWDRHSGADSCPDVLGHLSHTSTLMLDMAGEWVVRARGRRLVAGTGQELPVIAEKTIVVR